MSFADSFKRTVVVEGGYANNPKDPGGETMYGITKRVAVANGYRDEMRLMPLSVAQTIYKKQYWDVNRLDDVDDLSPELAHEMFDTGVNCGVAVAGKFLQRSLNVLNRQQKDYADITADGVVGPVTIHALKGLFSHRAYGARVLLAMLNALQGAYYVEISEKNQNLEEFIFGWFRNRVII